jgi:hypothetical protein
MAWCCPDDALHFADITFGRRVTRVVTGRRPGGTYIERFRPEWRRWERR